MNKKIALVSYGPDYFWPFAKKLEDVGFEVFWICIIKSTAKTLVDKFQVPENKVLDTSSFSESFEKGDIYLNLSKFEDGLSPTFNEIKAMDRVLRHKEDNFSNHYLDSISSMICNFLLDNNITLISTGRDSALQLTTLKVANYLNIPTVVPTRMRIPQEVYGFCKGIHHENFYNFFLPSKNDISWSEKVMQDFESKIIKPDIHIAASNFLDTFRLLPRHAKAFLNLAKVAIADRKNDFSRYTLFKILKKYFIRRINMFLLIFYKPWTKEFSGNYCIYALHTQPESSVDVAGSFFSDQINTIQVIAKSLPISHKLLVKVHPADRDGKSLFFYNAIKRIPGVQIIDPNIDIRTLLDGASLIFTITGTIGLEGGLLGKPVITFSKVFFNELPSVFRCSDLEALTPLVSKLLNYQIEPNWRESSINFLSNLRSCMFDGEVNRVITSVHMPLTVKDLDMLGYAYNTIYKKLVEGNNLIDRTISIK